jgi:hypothetical protein
MPFSPHLADLQPVDASQKFGYSAMRLEFGLSRNEIGNDLFKVERSLTYL